jgi:uncharacterized phage protein gp47/JayE
MATPTPQSYEQLISQMYAAYQSRIGINDINVGSAVSSFFEVVAQKIYLANASNFSILRDYNLDRASGEALKRIAAEDRVFPLPARVATGRVNITDSSFTKKSTKVYAGAAAPNVGSTVIKVSDASGWPNSGAIYIGRGTNNIEGPISYSSITQLGGFYQITLVTPTTKFHNISESVILAQGGNRFVPAGSVVIAPASGGAEDVNFTITQSVTMLDGENEIKNVPVAAQKPGAEGNVPRGAIKRFISPPFTGATVTNAIQFTTGRDEESDQELKARVKRARLSRGLGTAIAVQNSVLGQQAPDEAATVLSAEIFSSADETVLYIDNGQGYEEKTEGVGVEFIVDEALGGETNFQLATGGQQSSVAKAFIESNAVAPFAIIGGDRLAISVGGVITEHVFKNEDFRSPGAATAYEIISSVNANPDLNFSARTSENATKVTFFAKTEEREYIQKTEPSTGRDAGFILGLPVNEVETLRLYKNGQLLSKNGRFATIESQNQQTWSPSIASGDTLNISVDGTQFINYTFTDADFANEGTFTTVNKNNTLQSWCNVINNKIVGITALPAGNKIKITSNLGADSRASIDINPLSTLVTKGMFAPTGLSVKGAAADFKLSRNTAQFKLTKPLTAGDSLSAGTESTKANISSGNIVGGTVTLTQDGYFWLLIDDPTASIIRTGMAADVLLNVLKPSANIVRYQSLTPAVFNAVQVGDWVIVRSLELNANNRLEGRVHAVTPTTLDILVTATEYAAAVAQGPILFQDGFIVVRTKRAVQKLAISAGTYNLFQISELINADLVGATCSVLNDKNLIITTKTEDITGSVLLVDIDTQAKILNFTSGQSSVSDFSLFGFYESQNKENSFPAFVHSEISGDEPADPPLTYITSFNSSENLGTLGVSKNLLVCGAEPFDAPKDSVIKNEVSQIRLINGTTVDITQTPMFRRMRTGDRYFLCTPYDFSEADNIVVVLDNDVTNKSFPIPLNRKAATNQTTTISSISFRAYDIESGPAVEFSQYFGADFDFSNYKVMMQARGVIHPTYTLVDEDAVLIRSKSLGSSGNKIRVSYEYPTQPNQGITDTVAVSELTKISIFLKSGNPVSNTIDGTTEWNVTITPMVGYDQVTYTWNGTGTNPTISGALSSGGYATITAEGEFSPQNIGTFRVVSATATSFTVARPTGAALAESNVATLTSTTIRLYESDDTTAQEIVDYINDNLADFIEASIIDDNGTTGSGVIDKSTFEDSFFTSESVALVDGENYILSSNLTAVAPNAQFTFKTPLTMPSFSTATPNAYAFNNGEVIKLIPTTAKQVEDFVNVLAVSGVSTVGTIRAVAKESRVQIRSDVLGSSGSVQVAGGRGNLSTAEVQQAAIKIDDQYAKVVVERSSLLGFHGGQYVKLKAQNLQKKDTEFSDTSVLDVTPNSPIAGKTSITISNKQAHELFFGKPKTFIRDIGTTFRVEKHGILTAIIADPGTNNPHFEKDVEFNDVSGVINVSYNTNTGFAEYTATSPQRNFSEVPIGAKLTISGFTNPENNGTFTIVGVSSNNKTLVVENPDAVSESGTTISPANISIAAEVAEGDTVIIDAPFSVLNRGTFKVIRRFENTIWIENPSSVEEDVAVVANAVPLTFNGSTQFDLTMVDNGLRIQWNGNGANPSLSLAKVGQIATLGTDFHPNNQGSFCIVAKGTNFIIVANALGVNETAIQISNVFQIHKPSLRFYEYESTVENDTFVVGGDLLGEASIGLYKVFEVFSENRIIVDGIIAAISNFSLGNRAEEIYVQEQSPYYGYKKVYNKAADPANLNQGILVFDSANQYLKINKDAGAVKIYSMSKLEFPTNIKKGVDSYRYNIGLIRQANKVVYGEPRGGEFEGVAAAGAEIFIQPPLIRRIQVSIVVRLNTGVPFTKIIERVRDSVASLVNSTGIGQSIPLSDVVSTVNSIPGVFAVSIASPSYSPSLDLLVVNPSEKPLIIDPVADIIVSKVGS